MNKSRLINILRDKRKDKKGQTLIEICIAMILASIMLTAMVDFSLILQAKTETATMARNGVRILIMKGVDVSGGRNERFAQEAEKAIAGIYEMNHPTAISRKHIALEKPVVKNTPSSRASVIKNGNTGVNAIEVEVCEIVKPISGSIVGGNVRICSQYAGFHSAQYKPNKSQ